MDTAIQPEINPTIDPETGVNCETKKYIAITVWVIAIMVAIDSPLSAIIMSLIAWYWFAPYLAKFAKRHNRDPTWAFLIGALFAILGIVIYWIYEYFTRKPGTVIT